LLFLRLSSLPLVPAHHLPRASRAFFTEMSHPAASTEATTASSSKDASPRATSRSVSCTPPSEHPPFTPPASRVSLLSRGKNFVQTEDEQLCRSWLNVSQDPVTGSEQKSTAFWARVHQHFVEFKTTPEDRTAGALQSRWNTIQAQVNKFCGSFAQVESRNESGKTLEDLVWPVFTPLFFFLYFNCVAWPT
jgi:hypothetical protein